MVLNSTHFYCGPPRRAPYYRATGHTAVAYPGVTTSLFATSAVRCTYAVQRLPARYADALAARCTALCPAHLVHAPYLYDLGQNLRLGSWIPSPTLDGAYKPATYRIYIPAHAFLRACAKHILPYMPAIPVHAVLPAFCAIPLPTTHHCL